MPRVMLRRIRIERWITYALWVVMAGTLVWGIGTWVAYLDERAEQAEAQTKHMADLLERSTVRQEQLDTLLSEFRASVKAEKAARREFERKADAIIRALGAQVERLSNEKAADQGLQTVLAAAVGPTRPRRVMGQGGSTDAPPPRPREPVQAQPAPAPDLKPKPQPQPQPAPQPPERRAEHQPPPQNKPPKHNAPPPQRQPPTAQDQSQPDRPGKANPPGKAKGHHKKPPGKAKKGK